MFIVLHNKQTCLPLWKETVPLLLKAVHYINIFGKTVPNKSCHDLCSQGVQKHESPLENCLPMIIRECRLTYLDITSHRLAPCKHLQRLILGCRGTRTLVHCCCECQLLQSLWRWIWQSLVKLKVHIPYNPAISLLVYSLEILPKMYIMRHN